MVDPRGTMGLSCIITSLMRKEGRKVYPGRMWIQAWVDLQHVCLLADAGFQKLSCKTNRIDLTSSISKQNLITSKQQQKGNHNLLTHNSGNPQNQCFAKLIIICITIEWYYESNLQTYGCGNGKLPTMLRVLFSIKDLSISILYDFSPIIIFTSSLT